MKSFFDLFEIPAHFSVDQTLLEKKYLNFQGQFHPDKSSSDDISRSIEINEAYKFLSDDFLRACHLLQLQGIDLLNDEKAVKPDIATLEEVLELQERITEISDKNEIEDLRKKISSEIDQLIAQAVKCFESLEIKDSSQFLIKAKYLRKSLDDLKIRKKKLG